MDYLEKGVSLIGMKYNPAKPIKEFPYKIDPMLKYKLDLLIKTLDTRDVWILLDGDEGSGKTNMAVYLLYYFHCVTGREFTLDRFYFDSDDMFNWVKDNENGLICWDEACLGGLSSEWATKSQINLLKFAMTGRKKHHVFILNVPRFNKLKEDLRKDRIHALIHMDLGKRGDKYGHYIYLTRKGIKALNRIWEKKKLRPYASCAKKFGGFYSNVDVPFVIPQLMNENDYEKKKDKAISSIGQKKENPKRDDEYEQLKLKIGMFPADIRTKIAPMLGISDRTLRNWAKLGRRVGLEAENGAIIKQMGTKVDLVQTPEESNEEYE